MDEPEVAEHARADRLAELVVHLTDCAPERALRLVDTSGRATREGEELDVVARAIVQLRASRAPQRSSIDLRPQVRTTHGARK